LLFIPVCFAQVIELPGCTSAKIGVNSIDPTTLFSPDCERVSDRLLDCECLDEGIDLYSKSDNNYTVIIDYIEQDNISKRKTVYNFKPEDDYVDEFTVNIIGRFVLGLLIVPIILSWLGYYFFKKRVNEK